MGVGARWGQTNQGPAIFRPVALARAGLDRGLAQCLAPVLRAPVCHPDAAVGPDGLADLGRPDPIPLEPCRADAHTWAAMTARVTPADTASHLAALARAGAERARQRASRLTALLPGAARLLREDHGARGVIVFGSLALGTCTDRSDVDLAVVGMPGEAYFSALADLFTHFGGPVDLVRLEEAPASLAQRIAAEGRAL